jgi:hypothetical protein
MEICKVKDQLATSSQLIKRKPHWYPSDCECCNAPYDPETWKADYSLSGELIWSCPKCGHSNYPRLD